MNQPSSCRVLVLAAAALCLLGSAYASVNGTDDLVRMNPVTAAPAEIMSEDRLLVEQQQESSRSLAVVASTAGLPSSQKIHFGVEAINVVGGNVDQAHWGRLIDDRLDNAWVSWRTASTCDTDVNNLGVTPYLTIDLGATRKVVLDKAIINHFYTDGRRFCRQNLEVSMDGTNYETVFTTGTEYGPKEDEEGHVMTFPPTAARYVRYRCGRSTNGAYCLVLNMKLFGTTSIIDTSAATVSKDFGSLPNCGSTNLQTFIDDNIALTSPRVCANSVHTCGQATLPSLTVDLKKDHVVDGFTLYHYYDGRKFCDQKVELALNANGPWTTVYDTGPAWGPEETFSGITRSFTPTVARYVKHTVGRNSFGPAAHFIEMRLYGTEDDGGIRIAVSGNGRHVYASRTGEFWYMNGLTADGSWNNLYTQVPNQFAVDNDNNLFTTDDNQKWYREGVMGPGLIGDLAVTGDGSYMVGTNAWNFYARPSTDTAATPGWTEIGGLCSKPAVNSDGSYIGCVFATGHPLRLRSKSLGWINVPFPSGVVLKNYAIGGDSVKSDLWITSEENDLWHADLKTTGGTISVQNWTNMGVKMLSIAATSTKSGALFGVSQDRMGVIHCRGRADPSVWAAFCEYVIGPGGPATVVV